MLKAFRAFLERRRLKNILGRHVPPEFASGVVNGTLTTPNPDHTERNIEVAFIAISAPDAKTYSEHAGVVAGIASEHGGVVQSLLPVFVVAFGTVQIAPSGARSHFITSVRSRLPEVTAIVHGTITANVGSFGGERRAEFGFWWKGALDVIQHLATLSPGQTYEFPSDRDA